MERRKFLVRALMGPALYAALSAGLIPKKARASSKEHRGEYLSLINTNDPTPMEQKHVPLIQAPYSAKAGKWIDIDVLVGFKKEHPSTKGHWIRWIKLLADGREVARTTYPIGGVCAPRASFRIRLQGDASLEAIADCNLHGTWISEPHRIAL